MTFFRSAAAIGLAVAGRSSYAKEVVETNTSEMTAMLHGDAPLILASYRNGDRLAFFARIAESPRGMISMLKSNIIPIMLSVVRLDIEPSCQLEYRRLS